MLTKTLVFTLLAACGVHPATSPVVSNPAAAPDERDKPPPDEDDQRDQQFCCQSVDPQTASGEGCAAISKENINACLNVLSCGDKWVKQDGKVTCL
jgi:hypothetical protein